jgi:hypothetical protein
MGAELFESIIDYQMTLSNMNESLYGIEKELMIKEHKAIVKNEAIEIVNKDNVKRIIEVIKKAIIKFKDWLVEKLTKFIRFIKSAFKKGLQKLQDLGDKIVGNVVCDEDISVSLGNYHDFIIESNEVIGKVMKTTLANHKDKNEYNRAKSPQEKEMISLLDRLEKGLRATGEKRYNNIHLGALRVMTERVENVLDSIQTLGKDSITSSQKIIASSASITGEYRDRDSLAYFKLTDCAKQFNFISGMLTRVTSNVFTTSDNITKIIRELSNQKRTAILGA